MKIEDFGTMFDLRVKPGRGRVYTCSDILSMLGYEKPNKKDLNEVGYLLRQAGFERKVKAGTVGYRLKYLWETNNRFDVRLIGQFFDINTTKAATKVPKTSSAIMQKCGHQEPWNTEDTRNVCAYLVALGFIKHHDGFFIREVK